MDFVSPRKLYFAGLTLDLGRIALMRGDGEIVLRPKSFDVLRYLAENPGRLVTKDELIEKVWAGIAVTDDSLVQCVKEIREAIGDEPHHVIKTLPRRGYLFAAEVTERATLCAPPVAPASSEQSPAQPAMPARADARDWTVRAAWIAAAAAAALLLGVLAWSWQDWMPVVPGTATAPQPADGAAGMQSKPSLAVLPFLSLSESADDYFADGLAEDIISALGRFTDLSVRSRSAVLPFKGKAPRPDEIGRELDVRYVVEGSVRRIPERIRIAVRLTDTARGTVLWSQQYDTAPDAIFEVQDDMTRQIAGSLAVRLTDLELARTAAKPPANLEAYDLTLQGRAALWRDIRASNFQARTLFAAALALDPDYIPALVGLGLVESEAIAYGWTADPAEALRRAERLGEQAVALDEKHPGGHQLLGRVYSWRGDYDRALAAIQRAIELNPSDVDNYLALAKPLLWSGDLDGAIAALETARQVGTDTTVFFAVHLGIAYVVAGRSAEAIRVLERSVTRDRTNVFTQVLLGAAYAEAGSMDKATHQVEIARGLAPFVPMDELGSLFRNPEHRQRLAAALQKAGF